MATAASNFLGAQKLEDGIGLCLSGGGFRAALFHLGALIRLNQLGLLSKIDRIASVWRLHRCRRPRRGME